MIRCQQLMRRWRANRRRRGMIQLTRSWRVLGLPIDSESLHKPGVCLPLCNRAQIAAVRFSLKLQPVDTRRDAPTAIKKLVLTFPTSDHDNASVLTRQARQSGEKRSWLPLESLRRIFKTKNCLIGKIRNLKYLIANRLRFVYNFKMEWFKGIGIVSRMSNVRLLA